MSDMEFEEFLQLSSDYDMAQSGKRKKKSKTGKLTQELLMQALRQVELSSSPNTTTRTTQSTTDEDSTYEHVRQSLQDRFKHIDAGNLQHTSGGFSVE